MSHDALCVVVTGASGIAAATARQLVDAGHRCYIVSRTDQTAAELSDSLGPACAGHSAADLGDEGSAEAAFAAARDVMGRIDAVVAVAGGSARRMGDGWVHEMSLAAWDSSLTLNLTTMFLTAREAIRHMRAEGGSLVMTSSVLATSPQPQAFTTHGYAAAKAAISGWTVPLAAAYAPDGVRVNTVAPGLVRTPMAQRAADDPEIVEFARRKQPLIGGLIAAEDVARANCWFVETPGVTGQVLAVDGGWSVTSTS